MNVEGREPKGFVKPGEEYNKLRDDIASHLKEISINGIHPIKTVKRREEIYWGANFEKSPDLVTIFKAGWQAARRPEILNQSENHEYVNDQLRWSGGHDGTHDPIDVPGILGILGSHQRKNGDLRVHLRDLAPTVIKAMGLHIPSDMDGKNILS